MLKQRCLSGQSHSYNILPQTGKSFHLGYIPHLLPRSIRTDAECVTSSAGEYQRGKWSLYTRVWRVLFRGFNRVKLHPEAAEFTTPNGVLHVIYRLLNNSILFGHVGLLPISSN
ncbi:hypothetical protein OIDMADRAFT_19244 [Oidiodendron maius Zn]|uniref:Uncharacterized protein n=1 Tax=Oidiodendron maius (strain Zn) TaxID=913774 RepID=A0A0C3HG86_OIDMZ|nr:hypothetical protein OIDMADRAFT_19244 [Oidiodendron maius Zn]